MSFKYISCLLVVLTPWHSIPPFNVCEYVNGCRMEQRGTSQLFSALNFYAWYGFTNYLSNCWRSILIRRNTTVPL